MLTDRAETRSVLDSVFPSLSLGIAAAIALVPAAFAVACGRRLAKQADDPVLPERLQAYRARANAVTGVCMAALAATGPSHLIWTVPLLIVARAAAGYPLRKALYRETWNPAAYLLFFTRMIVAALGFWIVVATMPYLISLAGSSCSIRLQQSAALGAIKRLRHARKRQNEKSRPARLKRRRSSAPALPRATSPRRWGSRS